MISDYKINSMGTVAFSGKFGKMRKAANFVVYPMSAQYSHVAKIQSDAYCGKIDMRNGDVYLGKDKYSFARVQLCDKLQSDELAEFLVRVRRTGGSLVGNNGVVFCNNVGALNV